MSTNKTPQYQLHSWTPADSFVRTEFNENFTKLDAALAAVSDRLVNVTRLACGAYRGTGAYNDNTDQFISLPFTPGAVLVELSTGIRAMGGGNPISGGIALRGNPAVSTAMPGIKLESGGFRVYTYKESAQSANNNSNMTYYYIALQ